MAAIGKKWLVVGSLSVIIVGYLVLKSHEPDAEINSASSTSLDSIQTSLDPSAGNEQKPSSTNGPDASKSSEVEKAPKIPSQVLTKDIKIGHTKIVTPGTRLSFHIMAKLEDGKIVFDSLKENRPWTGTVGDGSLLPGIDRGIRGMMMGGKRAMWISPDLAYGEYGINGQIPPNAKIYAEIDLLEVY